MSDIDINVRINDWFKVISNSNIRKEQIEYDINKYVRSLFEDKTIKVHVHVLEDHEQKAIDIGKNILDLIDTRSLDHIDNMILRRS